MKSAVWALLALRLCTGPAFAHPNHDEVVPVPCTLYPAEAEPLEGVCRLYEAVPYVVVGIEFTEDAMIAAVSGAINLELAEGVLSTDSGETLAEGAVTIQDGPGGAFGVGALWDWGLLHLEFLPENGRASR